MSTNSTIKGRAWKFGNNVSTDSIAPGRLTYMRSQPEEFAKHVLEDANPEFPKNVKQGDFIVAGDNFGCGSSREIAPLIIKLSGVGAVMAKSFGRIFYRNAINNGMRLIQIDTDQIADGDVLTVDLDSDTVTKEKDPSFNASFSNTDVESKIIAEGGLLNYISKHGSLPV